MKITKCDKHPERDTVATFVVRELKVGTRPLLLGLEVDCRVIDLCQDCAEFVRPLVPERKPNDTTKT